MTNESAASRQGGAKRSSSPAAATPKHSLERALAADGKRSSANAVDASRLLGDADPERQAEIRRWAEFDACLRAIAGQRAGRGVKGSKRATGAGIVFQCVETGINRDRRVLEVVAELCAFGRKRAEVAERSKPAKAVHAHAAACAAEKPAVRKIVARLGNTAAVKARKVAVSDRALVDGATEAGRPIRDPIWHRAGLGMRRSPAQTERRQYYCQTYSACENRHPRYRQLS